MHHGSLIHDPKDNVAVTVRDVKQGEEIQAAPIIGSSSVKVSAQNDIPLAHKIALKDIKQGDPVIKYGLTIGVATQPITKGEHVHVHNLKSVRWGNGK